MMSIPQHKISMNRIRTLKYLIECYAFALLDALSLFVAYVSVFFCCKCVCGLDDEVKAMISNFYCPKLYDIFQRSAMSIQKDIQKRIILIISNITDTHSYSF